MSARCFTPGPAWRWARRAVQALTLVAILLAPLLGGWQRVDRSWLAAWDGLAWDLPGAVMKRLPVGDPAARAYEVNRLLGGGAAVRYATVPAIDPLAGIIVLSRGTPTRTFWIAWGLPIALAALAGRVFCGWMCPFGFIARGIRRLQIRLGWTATTFAIPDRRPLRWLLLGIALLSGAAGMQTLLYALLPHVLVQQSAYALWLLGGGGAVLGGLIGLVAAGLLFGPTTYCAALCPTGAALSGVARRRVVHVIREVPSACGRTCRECDNACWLQLRPSLGDPGPDCDACARCFQHCPRTNLRIRVSGSTRISAGPVALAALVAVAGVVALPATARAEARSHEVRPRLILNGDRILEDVTVAMAIIDLTGVKLDPDAASSLQGIELSAALARGLLESPDADGRIASRDTYDGPLTVRLERADGSAIETLDFDAPTSPRSTPLRTIYRAKLEVQLSPGDRVTLAAVPGWLDEPISWTVPTAKPAAGNMLPLRAAAAATLVFGGLAALALAVPTKRSSSQGADASRPAGDV